MGDDIAALVGSRICHDLISPIGAIGNGVELLAMSGGDTSAEMALITESIENANARIRFFRIAYGAATETQLMGRRDILSILSANARAGRFSYAWQVEGDQPRRDVRAAFLVTQCMESAMPLGGEIEMTKADHLWTLSARGKRFLIDQPIWDGLTDPNMATIHTAAQVQFALLPIVIGDAGRRLGIDIQPDRIIVTF